MDPQQMQIAQSIRHESETIKAIELAEVRLQEHKDAIAKYEKTKANELPYLERRALDHHRYQRDVEIQYLRELKFHLGEINYCKLLSS